jgi:hypothetical protein
MIMPHCTVCNDDGWVAYPTWLDSAKQKVVIRKVACPNGCPLRYPDEPGVLPTFPKKEETS